MATTIIPRPEYPRPILQRNEWLNLNGEWGLDFDADDTGLANRWYMAHDFSKQIIVPYPIESEASGIHDINAADIVWYQREFILPQWSASSVMLNVGACDFWTRVFINGQEVGQHQGGYSPFALDITHALNPGTNKITLRVQDSKSWMQPRGKQAGTSRWPIDYDTVTGIWQTIWLEPLNKHHVTETSASFSLTDCTLKLNIGYSSHFPGEVEVKVLDGNREIASTRQQADGRSETRLSLIIDDPKLWSPDTPFLYGLVISLLDGEKEIDAVQSYTGLREISVNNGQIYLNGSSIYLRGVLDQGYFPSGWYTPLDDDAIRSDVELTKAMGFNFARKHQKAEDPRYLYWADKLGLMVWAEMPSGRIFSTELVSALTGEWMSLIRRDRANPCVIGWVPFNESWGVTHLASRPEQRAFVDAMVSLTHSLDQSRPVIGNDGWEYTSGDLWTLHIYEGGSKPVSENLDTVLANPERSLTGEEHPRVGALPGADVSGLPILLTECGGIGFLANDSAENEFAYGSIPETVEELERRFRSIAKDVKAADKLAGFVWTQLTDIQQEINGVLYFDRRPKLPIETLHEIFSSIGTG